MEKPTVSQETNKAVHYNKQPPLLNGYWMEKSVKKRQPRAVLLCNFAVALWCSVSGEARRQLISHLQNFTSVWQVDRCTGLAEPAHCAWSRPVSAWSSLRRLLWWECLATNASSDGVFKSRNNWSLTTRASPSVLTPQSQGGMKLLTPHRILDGAATLRH